MLSYRSLKKTLAGELLGRYWAHDVARQSAALAYYLFFALFPLLIFLSNLLGALKLDVALVTEQLRNMMPASVVELIGSYLDYVSGEHNPTLMAFSLLFSVYFPYRAANTLMRAVLRASHTKPPESLLYQLKVLLSTLVLLLTIIVGLTSVVLGRRLMGLLQKVFPISVLLAELWLKLRFVLPALLVWVMVALQYRWALGKDVPMRDLWPGALAALACWLAVTFGFSYYVEHFANYSVIYGSIGAVIVLLLWLNLTALFMIMGAEYDMVRLGRRRLRGAAPEKGAGKDRKEI
ncbi:MAG: YihY/virulence factor BrkB family protein [Oscillospiraceae bacterium]